MCCSDHQRKERSIGIPEREKRYNNTEKGKKAKQKSVENYRKTSKYRQSVKRSSEKNRINNAMSTQVRYHLKMFLLKKDGHHWESLVGYTVEELKIHLESLFTDGMNWDNYGKFGWQIDHVIPKTSFPITSINDENFKRCWALSNLQPLWWQDNLKKSNKVENNEISTLFE